MIHLKSWLRASIGTTLFIAPVMLLGCGSSAPEATTVTPAEENVVVGGTQKGGQDEFGDYVPSGSWLQWFDDADHAKWTWSSVAAVFAETPDRIWIAQRGELPLPEGEKPGTAYGDMQPPRPAQRPIPGTAGLPGGSLAEGPGTRWHHVIRVVDGNGKTVQSWTHLDALFDKPRGRGPHAIKISPYDPEKHVWVVDDNAHMVYKFSYDGKLVKALGEVGVPGRDGNHFSRPTDIAFLPNGDFLIADGYIGTRVVKFNKDYQQVLEWGQKPVDPQNPQPGEFDGLHSIAVKGDRVYIADRNHGRVQVFDGNGKFVDLWDVGTKPFRTGASMVVLAPATEDVIWVSELGTTRFIKYDLKGHYLYSWGSRGSHTGGLLCSHGMTVDQNGNLYVADCTNGRVNKYMPKPGANPAKLIGMEKKGDTWK